MVDTTAVARERVMSSLQKESAVNSLKISAGVATAAGLVSYLIAQRVQARRLPGKAEGLLRDPNFLEKRGRRPDQILDYFEVPTLRKDPVLVGLLADISPDEIAYSPAHFENMLKGLEALCALQASIRNPQVPVDATYRELIMRWRSYATTEKMQFFHDVGTGMFNRPLHAKKANSTFNSAAWNERHKRTTEQLELIAGGCLNDLDVRILQPR